MKAQPTLYLMFGYPGAGKTTTAQAIHDLTGAVHLWADHIRRERYGIPTYSHEENVDLYNHMNELTAELLAARHSVVFDTSFNYYKDRQHLRDIAHNHNAEAVLIWVKTPKEIAKERATNGAHIHHTRVLGDMTHDVFERLTAKPEAPGPDEPYIPIDGTKVTSDYIAHNLHLA